MATLNEKYYQLPRVLRNRTNSLTSQKVKEQFLEKATTLGYVFDEERFNWYIIVDNVRYNCDDTTINDEFWSAPYLKLGDFDPTNDPIAVFLATGKATVFDRDSKDPADLKAEFDYILERQKAILEDLKGVAAAVEKTEKNSVLAKNILTGVGVVVSVAATVVSLGAAAPAAGAAITAATVAKTATTLSPLVIKGTGSFFTLRANNKLKKYYARVDELTIEYNNNNKRLLELDKILNPKTPMFTAGDAGGNKLKLTTPQIAVIGLAVVIIGVLLWRYNRR
jgi:hypothetical protein